MAKFTGSVVTAGLSGAAGTVVFVHRRDGRSYIRPRVVPRNPQTPLQMEARARLTLATRAYQSLTLAQVRAWVEFASNFNAQVRQPQGQPPQTVPALFSSLAVKWLQVHGGGSADVPRDPPPSLAVGDAVVLTVSSPSSGVVRVSASQPNAAGMITEVLLQPLPSAVRKPRSGHYRHAAFVGFVTGAMKLDLPVSARYVAVAARFVCAGTGQVTGLVELGVVACG